MNEIFLQLGSNVGDRSNNLLQALTFISEKIGEVVKVSKLYESSPWRVDNQRDFLNQVIYIRSKLDPFEVLNIALEIEREMGRVRVEKWGERKIDIDILFFNDEIIETDSLCIPHQYISKRNFVLKPMCEIASEFIHPKFNKSIVQLLEECLDEDKVELYVL